jgi:hypothetical protein
MSTAFERWVQRMVPNLKQPEGSKVGLIAADRSTGFSACASAIHAPFMGSHFLAFAIINLRNVFP